MLALSTIIEKVRKLSVLADKGECTGSELTIDSTSEESAKPTNKDLPKLGSGEAHSTDKLDESLTLELLTEFMDTESMNRSSADNVGALFEALYLKPEDSYLVKRLAAIGQHLADDWGYLTEANTARLDDMFKKEINQG